MNHVQKLINAAFENLLRIPVSGDGAEKMASGKALLSQAHQEAAPRAEEHHQHRQRSQGHLPGDPHSRTSRR